MPPPFYSDPSSSSFPPSSPPAFSSFSSSASSSANSSSFHHTAKELILSSLHELSKRTNPRIIPNQRNTYSIVAICIFFVFAFVFWHTPVIRDVMAACKLLVVGFHELCHVIDPNTGGRTQFSGLLLVEPRSLTNPGVRRDTVTQDYWSISALVTLSAGYVGSELVGGALILCGFDITASKIASFFIGVGLLVPLAMVDHFVPILSILATEGLMIGLWWGDHGEALRYFVLWIGVLQLFYVVWDVSDERFFDKQHPSDCSQFEELIGGSASCASTRFSLALFPLPSHLFLSISVWALWFFCWAILVLAASVIGGIALFKRSPEEVYERAKGFLPT
ncbi:peptidase M50B-like-domain-containing protein [Mrakia frigida]|uniref:peptidase M50B-like-domain-containing protein n=1 Tax=Mrakia frigida TaxID=29902 RepID=UPI003FCC1D4F